jgi:hypothetical protein
MKANFKFLLAATALTSGLMLTGALAPAAQAQVQEQTTTTRQTTMSPDGTTPVVSSETTTTRSDGMAPAPPLAAPMPGYETFGYSTDNYAAHRGYNDGYDKGVSDHNTGHSYRPTSDHYYNHPIGFNGGPVTQDEYNRVYREAFLHGYERGYRNSTN